jgi:formylglycine-generating enzyme required for sulfatase activity
MRLNLLCVTIAMLVTTQAAAKSDWPQDFWNPEPLDGDIILPLPCNGAIAFRRIDTPVEGNWLADEEFQMGNSGVSGQEHIESSITKGLVGGLTHTDAGDRFYLLGKYEVTADQYTAVMSDTCPKPDDAGSVPAQDMHWLDAQTFAARLTGWLYQNDRANIMEQAGPGAFLRLPSEEEWEFAARGGLAVTEPERRKTVFTMDGPLTDYVWFAGFKGCDGAAKSVGLLKPNALGLYDILGNVQEYTTAYFQLRTHARTHGQVGGIVARGGSCLTNEARVRTSDRDEVTPYDHETGAQRGKPFTGLRVMFGAPILIDQGRINAINADWLTLDDTRIALDPEDDPITALGTIAASEPEGPVRDALLRAKDIFEVEMARRNQIESRSAQSVAQGGFLTARDFILSYDNHKTAKQLLKTDEQNPELIAYVRRANERLDITKDALLAAIKHAAEDYSAQTFDDAMRVYGKEVAARMVDMTDRTQSSTVALQALFGDFVATYRTDGDTTPDTFFDALVDYLAELKR